MNADARSISWKNPGIRLTRVTVRRGHVIETDPVDVALRDLVAYSQEKEFTRMWLAKGQSIEVKEGTEEIDRIVRLASTTQFHGTSGDPRGATSP